MYQNRKERRRIAKELGLHKIKNKSLKTRLEISKRSKEIGDKLHRDFTEKVYNENIRESIEKEKQFLKELIKSGLSEAEALEIIAGNKKIAEKRASKK